MTLSKFSMLLAMATRLGIKTIGELARIKEQNNLVTNDDLYDFLFLKVARD